MPRRGILVVASLQVKVVGVGAGAAVKVGGSEQVAHQTQGGALKSKGKETCRPILVLGRGWRKLCGCPSPGLLAGWLAGLERETRHAI